MACSGTLIDKVAAKLNQASPEMAVFRKTRGADGPLRYGDEFVVRMPGPWDGQFQVRWPGRHLVRLATLQGTSSRAIEPARRRRRRPRFEIDPRPGPGTASPM